jgi:hypothetical protein
VLGRIAPQTSCTIESRLRQTDPNDTRIIDRVVPGVGRIPVTEIGTWFCPVSSAGQVRLVDTDVSLDKALQSYIGSDVESVNHAHHRLARWYGEITFNDRDVTAGASCVERSPGMFLETANKSMSYARGAELELLVPAPERNTQTIRFHFALGRRWAAGAIKVTVQ